MSKRPPPQPGRKVGRPPGRGIVSDMRHQLMSEHLPAIVEKMVELALMGDVSAAKALLDRVLPTVKPQHAIVKIEMPDGSLTEQARGLMKAAINGTLPADIASELIAALSRIDGLEQSELLRKELESYA